MNTLSDQKRKLAAVLEGESKTDDKKTNGTNKSSDDSQKSIASITESLSILRTTFNKT